MPRLTPLVFLVIASLLATGFPTAAQDKKAPKKESPQKAVAAANMKKAELGTAAIVETDNFVVATTLTEEKAKALGAVLEKVVPVARKALQYEQKESAWTGKLAVYHLPENRDFRSFMRTVAQAQPDNIHYELKGDEPFVVDPVDVAAKTTSGDQFANTAAIVAGAYLMAKGGNTPDWFTDGFGRIVAARAEGLNSKRYAAYRAAARNLAGKGWKASDLWAETKPTGADVLATSFAEFLAFGPMAKDFPKIVSAFRPDENGNAPSVQSALEAGGWKDLAAMDAAWKRWATTIR